MPYPVPELYLGLMSGTSMDGVDGVLVNFGDKALKVIAHAHRPFPKALADEMLALNQRQGLDELHRAALAANGLARVYAEVAKALLSEAQVSANDVQAIGAHGQTVRHQPGLHDETGYTIQLNNPALLVELTGIAVVADFRSRDVAAGGQGAPLVPAFHQAVFGQGLETSGAGVAVLNIGGISNITILQGLATQGFDCGPGNALLDYWIHKYQGLAYDEDGRWAASGKVHEDLLKALMSEPYFMQMPPKSTGRDLFNAPWLEQRLQGLENIAPADVQATLTELTAHACAGDLLRHGKDCKHLYVCGGGALNGELMRRIQAQLPNAKVESTQALGLPPLQVEATAFAWLARKALMGEPGTLPAKTSAHTGAKGVRILGAIYPA